jgi:four helix bundle protein
MVNFEKLRVWQEAHKGVLIIYKLTSKLPKSEILGLSSQIRRASVSVELNIAESEGRFNNQEKIQYLYIARASCVEVRSALKIVQDLFNDLELQAQKAIDLYESLEPQLNSLIGYRKNLKRK